MCRPNEDVDTQVSSKTPPKTIHDPSRRVSFGGVKVYLKENPRIFMTQSQRHALWYQRSDYDQFKDSDVTICRMMSEPESLLEEGEENYEEEICTRGLERRMSPERQRLKNLAINGVLRAFRDGQSSKEVAVVARRLTSWASDLACKMGTHDYHFVYHPLLLKKDDYAMPSLNDDVPSLTNDMTPQASSLVLSSLKKRKRCAEESVRRVRVRLSHPKETLAAKPPVTGGWRRPRIAMWQPESWVAAR